MDEVAEVRSIAELRSAEVDRLVEFLMADPRGNLLALANIFAYPHLSDVRVATTNSGWTVGASRNDLPFRTLAFSAGDADAYRALIGDFGDRFQPGDAVYSLIPERLVGVLEQVVVLDSRAPETQYHRDLSQPSAAPEQAPALHENGFMFRALGESDLGQVHELMQASGALAFAEGSFRQGIYWRAFTDGELVSAAGTQSLARHGAEVGNVVTRPEHRRRGLARRCLLLLLGELRNHVAAANLFISHDLDFLPTFYESLGFAAPRPFCLARWRYGS